MHFITTTAYRYNSQKTHRGEQLHEVRMGEWPEYLWRTVKTG
jgi:hypothetical protein